MGVCVHVCDRLWKEREREREVAGREMKRSNVISETIEKHEKERNGEKKDF